MSAMCVVGQFQLSRRVLCHLRKVEVEFQEKTNISDKLAFFVSSFTCCVLSK